MNSSISSLYTRIEEAVARRRYSLAFDLLQSLAAAVKLPWETLTAIETLRGNYTMMRRFAVDGAEDPDREAFAARIGADILRLADTAVRTSLQPQASGLYYSTIRVEALQPDAKISILLERYRALYGKLSLAQMGNQKRDQLKQQRHELDRLADRIFGLVWITYPLTAADSELLLKAFADDALPAALKEMMLSALMLGNMEYFDERRISTLARVYLTASGSVEMRALASLMIALWTSRSRLASSSSIHSVLASVAETKPTWADDLKSACLALARTRDTQRVTATMRDEIIPEMMKLRPDLMKGRDKEMPDLSDMSPEEAMEMNPEWEEILEKSGLESKLRALSDMQAEGADVMMGTFANLKSFPFFRDPAAWFTPFEASHSAVTDTVGDELSTLAALVENMPGICDSDKYSLVLSLQRLPADQTRAFATQLKTHEAQMAEILSVELHPDAVSRTRLLDSNIHDAYRFFNLYRRKGEFSNPFSGSGITLAAVPALLPYVKAADAIEPMGEFYFRKGYYAEALPLFSIMESDTVPGAMPRSDLFQKMGMCYQSMGQYEKALEYYRKSEIIAPDSLWTIRRIALCSRRLGLHQQALDYYIRLAEKDPQSVALALSIGHCLLALDKPREAQSYYYKAQFLSDSGDAKYLRPLAWCAFLTGDFDKAEELYVKLLDKAETADWLNAGHVAMARRRYSQAVDRYRRAASGGKLAELIEADREVLLRSGVDDLMLDLIVDAALY